MSSSTPPPSSSTETADEREQTIAAQRAAEFDKLKTYAAYTFLVASPILIATPPRKLDFYTVSLCASFYLSANHLVSTRTGSGIGGHIVQRLSQPPPAPFRDLPSDKAEALQAQIRATREAQMQGGALNEEELAKLRRRQDAGKGVLERLWMGQESEGWKEKRLQEEAKALAEGKGYWDLILGYFGDAFSSVNHKPPSAEDREENPR